MNPPTATVELVPLAADVAASIELSRVAILRAFSRSGPPVDAEPRIATVSAGIRSGAMTEGRVCRMDGKSVGIALWDTGHPAGITVQILYLRPEVAGPAAYDRFLRRLSEVAGPVVFSPGGLVGLSDEEETALMHALGSERFARSEMRWPSGRDLPTTSAPRGVRIRSVVPEDEPTVAALHRAAFDGTFDQHLFLTHTEPVVNSTREVHEIMTSRFGEFLGWASSMADSDREPIGASLVVRAPYGPLLISVMVDRTAQGSGVGRALVTASLRALRERGETVAALNVTEGNSRAIRLYERLGFVRTIGPEHSWYSRAAIPVAPGESLSRPTGSATPDRKADGGNRTPRT